MGVDLLTMMISPERCTSYTPRVATISIILSSSRI